MVNQISWMAVKTSRHQVIRAWVGRERKRQEKTHFKNGVAPMAEEKGDHRRGCGEGEDNPPERGACVWE